jgi:hypothetical protein
MATHAATQPSILAVDCGTTGLKATLVGQDGRTLATAMHEYRNKTSSSAGGVVEQLPDDWWCDRREGREMMSAREKMGATEDGNRADVSFFAWLVCRYAMQQCVRELLSQKEFFSRKHYYH